MRFSVRTLAAVGAAGVLAIGVLGTAGVALADDVPVPGIEHLRKGLRHHRLARVGLTQLIQASGLDREVVREGLKDGQSLSEVFETNGVDTQAVIDEVLADLQEKLAAKVASGDITQEQADRVHGAAESALPRLANAKHLRRHVVRHVLRHELRIAADTIGISPGDLVEALRDGHTIADVAADHGVDAQTVVDAMVEPINRRVDAAEAAGKIDAERAADLKGKALERMKTLVNEGRPAKPAS